MSSHPFFDPCCQNADAISRRDFLKTTIAGAAAAAVLPSIGARAEAGGKSETLVASLFKTLNDEQKKTVAFPFDHPLRSAVDNNWHITKPKIAEFFTKDQQQMVREIFTG